MTFAVLNFCVQTFFINIFAKSSTVHHIITSFFFLMTSQLVDAIFNTDREEDQPAPTTTRASNTPEAGAGNSTAGGTNNIQDQATATGPSPRQYSRIKPGLTPTLASNLVLTTAQGLLQVKVWGADGVSMTVPYTVAPGEENKHLSITASLQPSGNIVTASAEWGELLHHVVQELKQEGIEIPENSIAW